MDNGAYNSIEALYKLLIEKKGVLDQMDVSYVTGVLKTLRDIYYVPPEQAPEVEKRSFNMRDIWNRD